MPIVKIPNEGDAYTGTIAHCREEAGKFGPEVKFTFANGDILYVSKSSADRQLIRCKFSAGGDPPKADYAAAMGATLHFSRGHNPNGKPFWNINVSHDAPTAPRHSVPADDPVDRDQVDTGFPFGDDEVSPPEEYPVKGAATTRERAYMELAERVAAFQSSLQKKHDIPFDAASINAMTFSIMGGIR